MAEELGIRIRADGVVEATNGIGLTGAAIDALGKKAAAASPQIERTATTARQTAAAFRLLPAQITDVVTSLASGQPAWLVAIQQGGQIKDSFGGIVPAARALVGALNPVSLALGLGAAAAGGLVLAYHQGRGEGEAFARALILTGNAAGTNAGQMADQARAVSAVVGTHGAAAAAIAALAGTGAVAAGQLTGAATAALQMERLLGVSVEDTAKNFASLGREPLAASLRLNQGTNYLTASVYKQIQALQSQGRYAEAAALAQSTYATAQKQRMEEVEKSLGIVERGWKAVGDIAKKAWDEMLGVGRPLSTQQQLDIATDRLNAMGGNLTPKARAASEQRIQALREQLTLEQQQGKAKADEVAKNQKEIEALSGGHQSALAGSERAGQELILAQTDLALAKRQAQYERLWQRNEITAADYQARLLSIELDSLAARDKALRGQVAIEQRRPTKDDADALSKKAAITAIEEQRIALQQQRVKLLAAEAAGERNIVPRSTNIGASTGLRAMQAEDAAAVEQAAREARAAADQAAIELRQTNRHLSVDLIKDDRARGMAQIAAEEEVLRRRLDMATLSAEDQMRVAGDLATWRVQREQQLTEQLKPEWQRMLETWADNNRLMKDSWDDTMLSALRTGEDAFVKFAQTGKLSVRDLYNEWVAQQARVTFRQMVSGTGGWGSLFGSILGLFGGGSSSTVGSMAGGSASTVGMSFHSGGVAGGTPTFTRSMPSSTWAGAIRYHGGGLAGDEVPAILKRKEGVFTEEQMAAMAPVDALAKGAQRNVTFAPTINIDSRTDRAEVAALVQRAMVQSQADLLDKMDRGEI